MQRSIQALVICAALTSPGYAQEGAAPDIQKPSASFQTGTDNFATGEISFQPRHAGLEAYLKKTGYLTEKSRYTLYRTGQTEPGTALKSVFALRLSDIGSCGSIGCTQIIITENLDGQFTLYDEFVGGELTMLANQTKGVHDLSTSTENGHLIGRFNGTKYTWSLMKDPQTAQSAPFGNEPDASAPKEISGECIEDRAWHGYRISPTEAAAGYGYCRTNRQANLLLFSCAKSDPLVKVTMNMSTMDLDDSEEAVITLAIAGNSYALNATAYYDVMSGFVLPEVDPIALDTALFDALETAPGKITLTIKGRQKSIHADGASMAVRLMRETCG